MSRKAVKPEDVIETIMDDRVIEVLVTRLGAHLSSMIDQKLDQKLEEKLDQKLSEFSNTIKSMIETVVNKLVTELLEKTIHPCSAKIEDLQKENRELRARVETTEVHSRRDSLIIHGIPDVATQALMQGPHPDANLGSRGSSGGFHQIGGFHQTEELVVKFCNDTLDLPIMIQDVSCAHRLPRGKNDKHRPILVTFTSHRIKEDVYGSRRKLRNLHSRGDTNAPVYINEHLTRLNAKIFAVTRQLFKDKKLFGTWTSGGYVYIKKAATAGEKPTRVGTLEELQVLQGPSSV